MKPKKDPLRRPTKGEVEAAVRAARDMPDFQTFEQLIRAAINAFLQERRES